MIHELSEDTGALYSGIATEVPGSLLTSALEFQVSPTRSANVFDNEGAHKRLPVSPKALTHTGLDVILQYLKDTKLLSPTSASNLIVVLQQHIKDTRDLPTRFDLAGVTTSGVARARGGSADIFQGYIQGQVVCVKKIRHTKDTLDKVLKIILDEVILCGYLPDHPNILPFLGIYRGGDIPSLVYRWMENGDLVSYLKRHPDSNRVYLFLHERSIVHGDIKGINILVNSSGRACIADFGLSSILPSRGGKQVFSEISNISLVMMKVWKGYRPKRPANSPRWNAWVLTEDLWTMIQGCWKADPVERPTIEGVIQFLEEALAEGRRGLDDDSAQPENKPGEA
ncbi:hypothetical protein H0H92_004440 [Tricholoma furcatifolium]|nr:hypothetical protein H0H92_004440 [Tricholoma furcatifolium]